MSQTTPIASREIPEVEAVGRTRDLDAALARGDEIAICAAMDSLARGIQPTTLLALVGGLAALGLAGLGCDLMRSIGAPLLAEPRVAGAVRRLQAIPRGSLGREEQARNVDANLAALGRVGGMRTGELVGLDRWLADESIEIPTDSKGRPQLILRGADGRARLLLPFALRADSELRARVARETVPVLAVSGVLLPQVLHELRACRGIGRAPTKAHLFEIDPCVVAGWLRCADFSDAIERRAVELHLGRGGVAAFLDRLGSSPDRAPPRELLVVRPEPIVEQDAKEFIDRAERGWFARRDAGAQRAAARVAGLGVAHWRDRFRAATTARGTLRIFGIASRHSSVVQHMMRDLLHALASLGHETRLVTESDASEPEIDICGAVASADWDLVLAINHLRAYPERVIPAAMPYVCWLQDAIPAAQTREAGASQGALDLVVTHSAGFYERLFGYPCGQSISAPNCTSWATYGAIGDTARQPGAPDVVYVGHGYEDPHELILSRGASPAARRLLTDADAQFASRLASGEVPNGFERMRIEAELLREVGGSTEALPIYWGMQTIFDRRFRHEALEWAARWCELRGKTLAIFGAGWERHPRFGAFARGPIANGPALAALCRDAGVILHANGNASLHQRLLDGVAAGGCVLTRRNPADWIARHHRALREARERGIDSLAALLAARERDASVDAAIVGMERSLGCAIAPRGDPRRDADCEVIRLTAFWPAETRTDDGLFDQLTSERGIVTPHGAADLDGFDATVYGSERELHELLDRVTADAGERDRLARPMRASVRGQFSMESLAQAILERMARMLERAGAHA